MERDASEQLTQAIVASKRVGIPSEAVVLRHLNHPHVIRFIDDFTQGQETYVYTEFIPRGSLATILSQTSERSVSVDDIRRVLKQCLFALNYLHWRGISHGSVRAESILIQTYTPLHIRFQRSREGADGTQLQADLSDLGTVLTNMLHHVADPPSVSTDCTAPWATLLAGLQQHDPCLRLNVDDCLMDAWLLGKREGKRSRAAEGSGEGEAEKRLKGNKAQAETQGGTDEVVVDRDRAPSRWYCIVM